MAEGIRMTRDEITPWLRDVAQRLKAGAPAKEVGDLMATMVREAHQSGKGLADGKPYASLSPDYAKRKKRVGGSPKILFGPSPGNKGEGGGGLFSSWKVIKATATQITVGAASGRGAKLASAHDGGLADKTGNPRHDRLRLGWNDKTLTQVLNLWMNRIIGK